MRAQPPARFYSTAPLGIRACCSVSKAISRLVRFGRPENSFDAPTMEVLLLLRLTLCEVVVVLAVTPPPPHAT